MSHLLIIDDHLAERETMLSLLSRAGYQCYVSQRGSDAQRILDTHEVSAVLTELQLVDMSGLRIVEHVRDKFPRVPTILITGRGNEDIAAEALQKGACSYIPKRRMEQDLVRTVQNVLGLKTAERWYHRLAHCWLGGQTHFELGNSIEVIPSLVTHLQDQLRVLKFGDESTLMRIGVALTESLENAIYHGNLELSSELRKGDGSAWVREHHRRREIDPYRDRCVKFTARLSRDEAEFLISDDGAGFNPQTLPDPTDLNRLEAVSGRGVYLIRMLMDEVEYLGCGNQVRMLKRRRPHDVAAPV
ncbi:response regulator [bacterium]|nr:response regulator [bacterium]